MPIYRIKSTAGRALVGASALLALAVALALLAGVALSFYEAFPDQEIEPRPGEGWLDTIFANEYVVFPVRIVLISLALVLVLGAIFVGASIVYRCTDGSSSTSSVGSRSRSRRRRRRMPELLTR